jgi:hypothetical protein
MREIYDLYIPPAAHCSIPGFGFSWISMGTSWLISPKDIAKGVRDKTSEEY